MPRPNRLAFALVPLALAACDEAATTAASGAPLTRMPTPEEQACLRGVTAATNNPDVVLLGSEFSQAGTSVRVGVGAARATWSCTAYADGTTGNIMSLVDEGAA